MAKLIDTETGDVLLKKLEIADTFWKRFRGLQCRRLLAVDAGLWLKPCSSLHTCFMRFPIDVVMLDAEGVVLGIKSQIRPWRAVICDRGTTQVVETSPGCITVETGTRLSWIAS